ncbi:FKBP-type peptidyl-prolyl cis-trans isomerase [bacterium]|nr:FKBP-type peptidyl-prolyl cis-trans isomerase [bacterium]
MSRWLGLPHVLWALSWVICGGLIGCESAPAPEQAQVPLAPALDTPAAPATSSADMETTESGLKYKVHNPGSEKKPLPTNTVTVNYRGWLDNGEQFDAGQGITFGLNQVIPGWTEGLQLVGEGGKIELEIPSELAYGEQGVPGIPPNATLHFDVDLISIE